MINIICAMTKDGLIGKGDSLPWDVPEELKHFKKTTQGHTVIMGHNTFFKSLRGKPLAGRNNIVVSQGNGSRSGEIRFEAGLLDAIYLSQSLWPGRQIFIIGGRHLYDQALRLADNIYLSLIHGSYRGDVYFPVPYSDVVTEFPLLTKFNAGPAFDLFVRSRFSV